MHPSVSIGSPALSRALLVALLIAGSTPVAGQPTAQPAAACTVRELSRTPLVLPGNREMYVEPSAVIPSRGEIMLAGMPNYLWEPGAPGTQREVTQDSVFGVILGTDGRPRLLPAPIDPARLAVVRGVALENGGWAVAFAEQTHPRRPPRPDTIVRFWYAVHDGKSWITTEPLPIPSGGPMLTAGASNLLVRGDTVRLAVRVSESGVRHNVALFERRAGKWTVDVIPTSGAAAVRLLHSPAGTLLLGVVRADRNRPSSDEQGTRSDRNSLFIGPRDAPWTAEQRVQRGGVEPVYEPEFSTSSSGPVLTWWVLQVGGGRGARAMVGAPSEATPVIHLDSSIETVRVVTGRAGPPIWITHHNTANGGSELRFLGLNVDGKASVLLGGPSPFTGPFGVAATTADDVIVSGPLLRKAPDPHPSLVTLLIRARVGCASRAP